MKRLFTLVALAAALVSANAKTLWTGSCTFAGYTVESGERPVFTPADFEDAVIGDKLVFTITNNANDTESWHQVELWHYDGEKPYESSLCQGIQVLANTVSVEFTLDKSLLDGLRSGETCAAGTGYTVTAIDLTTFDGIIWEGVSNCPDWTANPAVNIPGSAFAVAHEGDELVFTVEKLIPGSWAGIQIDTSDYQASVFGTTEIADDQTEVRFTLNAELLSALVTKGINITGMNFQLTKIQLIVNGGGDVPPVEDDDAIWSGSMTAGDWANFLTIPAEKFESIKAGDKLVFTVSNATEDGQICLKQNLPEGWAEMPSDAGEWGNYIHLTDGDGDYSFDVNAEAAASIKENGLVVAGVGYTLTKVAYADESAGITEVNIADTTSSAVYNLQGVKVADALDQITAPGLYISGGKKHILK